MESIRDYGQYKQENWKMSEKTYGNENYIPSMKLSGVCDSLGVTGKKFGGGVCSVTCEVTNDHLNAGGVAHGGLHSTMLDTALGGKKLKPLFGARLYNILCKNRRRAVSLWRCNCLGLN